MTSTASTYEIWREAKITTKTTNLSLRHAAIVAGSGLVVMTIFAVLALYFIFPTLIVHGDAATTASNIMINEIKFRAGIGCFLVVIICDVLVAWALYVFLMPVNKNLSLLAAWFRLLYAIIFAIALTNYLDVLLLLGDAEYLSVFGSDQLHASVTISLNAFTNDWSIGLVFFGFHLVLLGYLAFKSHYIPRVFGFLLIIAGTSYLFDYSGKILFPEFDMTTSQIAGWGELIFTFWLLIKGVKIKLKMSAMI